MPKTEPTGSEAASPPPVPEKTVLWVDPNLTLQSPSMKHLLHALPHLREAGWTVRIWCVHSEVPPGEAEHVFFRLPRRFRYLDGVLFFLQVNLHGWRERLRGRPRPATVIHATCGTYLGADVTSVHFLCGLWARRWLALGVRGWKEWGGYATNLWGAAAERMQWFSPALKLALPVSDSIAAELRTRTPSSLQIRTLPNSYDETRFNLETRRRWRETQRGILGYRPEDRVFVFLSQGHYKRKGFWLAVEALHLLRERRKKEPSAGTGAALRLLVVGGIPSTLATLTAGLDGQYPGWKDWITLAGTQQEVEKFYAAADAFLFPSYFEAFCLAEIEAAASGLPLLLTPHHGSEMTLRDGINGVRLSFDPAEMSTQIERFLRDGLPEFQPGDPGRGLVRAAYARELLDIYETRWRALS